MKRKVLFLFGLVVLTALVIFLVKALGRSPKQGELRVDSQPTASVFLDNKLLGRTPYKDKVQAGEYTLKITPESNLNQLAGWEGRIKVGASLLTYVNSNLAESELNNAVDVLWLEKINSKQSELSVVTNPDGASVLVNNETRGITPLTLSDIPPGDHTVTLASPGFLSRTLKIKTTPGYKLIASIKLALTTGSTTPEATASPTPTTTTKPTPAVTAKPTKTATSSATIPDPTKPFVIIKDTPTGFLRVRMEPSTAATEAARVNPGEKYHIFDEKNNWYQISYDDTNKGWISGTYAEKVE